MRDFAGLLKEIERSIFGADEHFAGISIRIGENQLFPNPEQEVKRLPIQDSIIIKGYVQNNKNKMFW